MVVVACSVSLFCILVVITVEFPVLAVVVTVFVTDTLPFSCNGCVTEEFDARVFIVCTVVELGADELFELTIVCVTGELVSDVPLGWCNFVVDEVFKASCVVNAFASAVVVVGIML